MLAPEYDVATSTPFDGAAATEPAANDSWIKTLVLPPDQDDSRAQKFV